ncbi:hypothetical protein BC936DRAFT_142004 [Jimgerdemannia flammicorona]|uniref:Uncharacterized protein n=1 Tax=Jimgerdemannia flammicorona TaxID=994334 RepID=A0A433DFK1_9FUNG|nr:hypothetical protein BC936DRAFT_142004 [Jimgerdemannia flammicorona]
MQFDSGTTVVFTLVATTEALDERRTTIYGSLGQIGCHMDKREIVHANYVTKTRETIDVNREVGAWWGSNSAHVRILEARDSARLMFVFVIGPASTTNAELQPC